MISMDAYKNTRAEADHVAALVRAALLCTGVPEAEARRVRARVTATGRAQVELGALRLNAAMKLLEGLPLAREEARPSPARPAGAFG